VEPGRREAAEEVLFAEATTLGVRRQEWERTVLDREVVTVETPYGPVGVKVGRRGGRVYNAQPEFDDCQRAAADRGVAVKEVWAAAVAAYRTRHPSPS
jgi:pyridinium-3,5-bisthiocarboxylic acid mononucleotide nickel chelatase